jgi:hypothetical protein
MLPHSFASRLFAPVAYGFPDLAVCPYIVVPWIRWILAQKLLVGTHDNETYNLVKSVKYLVVAGYANSLVKSPPTSPAACQYPA